MDESSAELTIAEQQGDEDKSWSWKRPSFHGVTSKVTVYNRTKSLIELFGGIRHIPPLVSEFRRSCFGPFLDWDLEDASFCTPALHALLGREVTIPAAREDELWFRIGPKNIRFSKNEFALMTGLRFGPSDFDTTADHTPNRNGLYRTYFPSSKDSPLVSTVIHKFISGVFRGGSEVDHLKVMKIIFVYLFVFGADVLKKRVEMWVWALNDDPVGWETFPWGTYGFQTLLRHIKAVKTDYNPHHKYHAYGCTVALLSWAYEAIPRLGSMCAIELTNPEVQRPQILRWKYRGVLRIDLEHVFVEPSECSATLEISAEEQHAYNEWWVYVGGDVDSHMRWQRPRRARKRTRISSPTTLLREVPIAISESAREVPTTILSPRRENQIVSPERDVPSISSLLEGISGLRREMPGIVQEVVDRRLVEFEQRMSEVVERVVSRSVGHLESRIREIAPEITESVRQKIVPEITQFVRSELVWAIKELRAPVASTQTCTFTKKPGFC